MTLGALASVASMIVAYGESVHARIQPLLWVVVGAGLLKLLIDGLAFVSLRDTEFTPAKRSAILLSGELRPVTVLRFVAGLVGTVVLPLFLVFGAPHAGTLLVLSIIALGFAVVAELAERYLFFTAVVRHKMPGGMTP